MKGQADHAEQTLARIPGRDALRWRIQELSNSSVSITDVSLAGKRYFYCQTAPGDDRRKLYVRDAAPDARERLLVDPGAGSAIDYSKPVLLHVENDAGHGAGATKSQTAAKIADEWAFLLWQAGGAEFQPANS